MRHMPLIKRYLYFIIGLFINSLGVAFITNARLASAFIYAFCTVNLDELEIRSWQEF